MTYPTPAPDNYDNDQKITVSPVQIEQYATSLNATVDDLNAHMDTIGKTWKSLKLGWAGQTETEVDSFNTQWTGAVTQMFGDPNADPNSKDVPPEGQAALGKIQALVKAAASTYAHTEESLCENALKFGEGLTGSTQDYGPGNLPAEVPGSENYDPSQGDSTPQKDKDGGYGKRDYTDAPIKETNASKK